MDKRVRGRAGNLVNGEGRKHRQTVCMSEDSQDNKNAFEHISVGLHNLLLFFKIFIIKPHVQISEMTITNIQNVVKWD